MQILHDYNSLIQTTIAAAATTTTTTTTTMTINRTTLLALIDVNAGIKIIIYVNK